MRSSRAAHRKPTRLRLAWHRLFCLPDREPEDDDDQWTCPTCGRWFYVLPAMLAWNTPTWHIGQRPS